VARQEIAGIEFEWDEEKALSNREKHGVEFGRAALAFFDLAAIVEPDASSEGEYRFRLIGSAGEQLVVFVAFTEREYDGKETIRIISARKAGPKERRRYFAER
jgi:uncharacterized DUF497 family protein